MLLYNVRRPHQGQGRAEPVAFGDFETDGRMEQRIRPLADARSLGPALRVCLGGRRLPPGADGRQSRGELPIGVGVVGISIILPSCDFVDERLFVWDAAIEAL